jgi:hypothetical protein
MSFSDRRQMSDERVLDVQSTDDALSVSLRDGRVITIAEKSAQRSGGNPMRDTPWNPTLAQRTRKDGAPGE